MQRRVAGVRLEVIVYGQEAEGFYAWQELLRDPSRRVRWVGGIQTIALWRSLQQAGSSTRQKIVNSAVTRRIFHDGTHILLRTVALAPSKLKPRVRFDFMGVAGASCRRWRGWARVACCPEHY